VRRPYPIALGMELRRHDNAARALAHTG
jgi:hypothetical protein